MSEEIPKNRLFFACPVDYLANYTVFMATALNKDPEEIGLALYGSASGDIPATHRMGSDLFTDTEAAAIASWVNEGGSGYANGVRCMRGLHPLTETTDNEPGKLQVTLYEEASQIPQNVQWNGPDSYARVTFSCALEVFGLQLLETTV